MPKRADLSDTFCPVGRSAELLGDRAVLLILRDLFFGRRRFAAIAANTGLGPQLVSARLQLMDKTGVDETPAQPERRRKDGGEGKGGSVSENSGRRGREKK